MTQPANDKAILADVAWWRDWGKSFGWRMYGCDYRLRATFLYADSDEQFEITGRMREAIDARAAAPRALPADDVGEKPMPLHRRLEWKAVADHFKALNEQLESENARLTAALAEANLHMETLTDFAEDVADAVGFGGGHNKGHFRKLLLGGYKAPLRCCLQYLHERNKALAEERAKGERAGGSAADAWLYSNAWMRLHDQVVGWIQKRPEIFTQFCDTDPRGPMPSPERIQEAKTSLAAALAEAETERQRLRRELWKAHGHGEPSEPIR